MDHGGQGDQTSLPEYRQKFGPKPFSGQDNFFPWKNSSSKILVFTGYLQKNFQYNTGENLPNLINLTVDNNNCLQ
jgi:hypothetical protein